VAISSVTAHRELLKTKEQLEQQRLRWETQRLDHASKLEAERNKSRVLAEQLATLQQENDALRQRHIGLEELREREAQSLLAAAGPKKKSEKAQHERLVESLQAAMERVRYLERQVREGEGMLARARASWTETSAVIEEEVKRLEAELQQSRELYAAATADKGPDAAQLELLQRRLLKSERMRAAVKKAMAEMEDEHSRFQQRLDAAVAEREQLKRDNELLKDELVKQGLALKEIAQDHWEMKEWVRLQAKK
jgi:DNA repair exonuclease SbcCD ATPase subunit